MSKPPAEWWKIVPNVGDTWRADEPYIKIKGDMKYLFALMDDETRFWIAQEVAESTLRGPRTEHVNAIKLSGDMNNNKMERFNGEIRDREKTMRGLKTVDTPILSGYQIFHNYIRAHEGLEGKTPAEACGITVKGRNKWLTPIQDASSKS